MVEHTEDVPFLPPSLSLIPAFLGPSGTGSLSPSDLIPKPDPEARTGPFPLGDRSAADLSRAEILAALPRAPGVYKNGDGINGVKISRISTSVVVKYGDGVYLHESRNMRLVAEKTTIRLPKIYDAWQQQRQSLYVGETTVTYIVMQYLDGKTLYGCQNDLSPTMWERINDQLLSYLQQLHKITSPVPGPVGGGVSEGNFFTHYGAGPFSSKAEIEEWFQRRLLVAQEWGKAALDLSFTGEFEHLVMCYMDVHLHNVLIDDANNIWLVDWANSGFYPLFFEPTAIQWHPDHEFFLPTIQALHTSETRTKAAKMASIHWALLTGAFCEPRGVLKDRLP